MTADLANGAVTDAKVTSISFGKITGAPTSLRPNGPAGGALTGAYPNPGIAANAVTSTQLASDTGSLGKMTFQALTLSPQGNFTIADGSRLGIGLAPEVTLRATGGEVEPTAGGILQLGESAGVNLGFDGTQILARSGGSSSRLKLQS